MNTHAYVTERTPERPWHLLSQCGDVWASCDPLSTFELISTIFAWKTKRPSRAMTGANCKPELEMSTIVDALVAAHPVVYGKHATLSSWTHFMTDKQLVAFCDLIDDAWTKAGKFTHEDPESWSRWCTRPNAISDMRCSRIGPGLSGSSTPGESFVDLVLAKVTR